MKNKEGTDLIDHVSKSDWPFSNEWRGSKWVVSEIDLLFWCCIGELRLFIISSWNPDKYYKLYIS